jgi:hypothetical protein
MVSMKIASWLNSLNSFWIHFILGLRIDLMDIFNGSFDFVVKIASIVNVTIDVIILAILVSYIELE